MKAEQGKNTKMFSDEEYKLKLERLKEVKQPGHKWLPQDYALVSKYDVLEVEKDGQILQRLVKVDKKDGSRKRYTTYEQLFDAIKEYHEENGKHTGRLLTFKKLKIIFANITMQQVILFIECCETCHQKQGLKNNLRLCFLRRHWRMMMMMMLRSFFKISLQVN